MTQDGDGHIAKVAVAVAAAVKGGAVVAGIAVREEGEALAWAVQSIMVLERGSVHRKRLVY